MSERYAGYASLQLERPPGISSSTCSTAPSRDHLATVLWISTL